MSLAMQNPLPGLEQYRREPSTMEMIQQIIDAAQGNPAQLATMTGVMEQLVALRQSEERFAWERAERQAKIDFDDALKACQKAIKRITPDAKREHNIKWATYNAIDTEIRPIYTDHGFGISFSQETASGPNRIAVRCDLTRSGISKDFHREMPVVAPGGTSQADAEESAYSRAQRYLVMRIFNISVGVAEAEIKPYETKPEDLLEESVVLEFIDSIKGSSNTDELRRNYLSATKAGSKDPSALKAFDAAKKETWKAKGFRA